MSTRAEGPQRPASWRRCAATASSCALAREAAFEIVDADPRLADHPAAARRARPAPHRRGHRVPHPQLTSDSECLLPSECPPRANPTADARWRKHSDRSSDGRRRRGRGPSGRGSPRSGRRRCRPAPTRRRRRPRGRRRGSVRRWARPPQSMHVMTGSGSSTAPPVCSACTARRRPRCRTMPENRQILIASLPTGAARRRRLRAAHAAVPEPGDGRGARAARWPSRSAPASGPACRAAPATPARRRPAS